MAPKAKETSLAQKEAQNMGVLVSAIKRLYEGSSDFSTLSPQVLINANLIPSSMINGNNIINSWGQTVNIFGIGLYGQGGSGGTWGFSIYSSGIPQGSCAQIAMAIAPLADREFVNGSFVKGMTVGDDTIDAATVASLCAYQQSGSNWINSVQIFAH